MLLEQKEQEQAAVVEEHASGIQSSVAGIEQENAKEEEQDQLKEVEHMSPEMLLVEAQNAQPKYSKMSSEEIKKTPSIESTKRLQRMGSDQH